MPPESPPPATDAAARRRAVVAAGHRGDAVTARAGLDDPAPAVRIVAVGALARVGALDPALAARALADTDPGVRRRALEVVAGRADVAVVALLDDRDPLVAEAAAWACGERAEAPEPGTVGALARAATTHRDPLVREAAVAALGAIGDDAGRAAVLSALDDKPAIRRRAALALAAFDGPDVDAALERARHDRDWQVRQAAEDVTGERAPRR